MPMCNGKWKNLATLEEYEGEIPIESKIHRCYQMGTRQSW